MATFNGTDYTLADFIADGGFAYAEIWDGFWSDVLVEMTNRAAGMGGAIPAFITGWDVGTTDANPGSGMLRGNAATVATTSQLFISTTDALGADVSAVMALFDDSTSSQKGLLRIAHRSNQAKWALFVVTGAVTAATAYAKVPVLYIAGPGGFAAGDQLALGFVPKGDAGQTGGATLPAGTVAAPGLSVAGDSNTGLAQLGGADTLSGVAGGAEIWRMSTSYVWLGGAPGAESLRVAVLPGAVAAVTVAGTAPGGMPTVSTTGGDLSVTSSNGVVRVHGQRTVHLTMTGADAGGVATLGTSGGDLNLASATGVVRLNGTPMGNGLFAGTLTKSANYTVVASDARYLLECTTSLTLSLTAAATLGNGFTFAVWNSGTGIVIIDPAGSETINGGATLSLPAGQWALVTCNGTTWKAPTQPGQSSSAWSPTDKEAALVVSANGLTASVAAGGAMQSGRGTKALSGKRYFEIVLDVAAGSGLSAIIGIATAAAAFGSSYGIATTSGGAGYANDTGQKLNNSAGTAFGSTWTAVDVIGVAYDDVSTPGSVKLWFSRNGVWQGSGDPATGASPAFTISFATFYPAITCKNGGQITARFSAAFWTYAAPSGFSQIP